MLSCLGCHLPDFLETRSLVCLQFNKLASIFGRQNFRTHLPFLLLQHLDFKFEPLSSAFLTWGPGIELRYSCLQNKHSTNGIFTPAQQGLSELTSDKWVLHGWNSRKESLSAGLSQGFLFLIVSMCLTSPKLFGCHWKVRNGPAFLKTGTPLFPCKVLSKVSSRALLAPDNYFIVFSVRPALF